MKNNSNVSLSQDLANFLLKGQGVNILAFARCAASATVVQKQP